MALLGLASCAALADGGDGEQRDDVSAVAEKLSNPTAAIGSLTNNFDYTAFDGDLSGADSQSAFTYTFQPVLPFPQDNGYNLIFRPAVPVLVTQPVFDSGAGAFEDEEWNLGNIGFDLVYGTTTPSGLLYSFGLVGAFPTASNDLLAPDAWSIGPEALVGVKGKWGLIGLLIGHQWDYAGDDDVSLTAGQYFAAFPLPQLGPGWQLVSTPPYSYNHEADSDDAFSLPIGGGLAKTLILGGRPWKLALQYWHYVESPDAFGPDWQVRLAVTPVMELPWSD